MAGGVTPIAVKLSPSESVSLSSRVDDPLAVRVTVPASSTVSVSLTVRGMSLTGLIVMVIVTAVSYTHLTLPTIE